ncbi:MAG: hypothetical protein ABEN55_13520 [Bradymonadaceae bacterium]
MAGDDTFQIAMPGGEPGIEIHPPEGKMPSIQGLMEWSRLCITFGRPKADEIMAEDYGDDWSDGADAPGSE